MKTIRIEKYGYKIFGFINNYCAYGKTHKGKFRIELILPLAKHTLPLWYSNKKPWFRNILAIAIFWAPFYYLMIAPIVITFLLYNYYDGCRNFIRDKVWVQNVRYFTWCNIVINVVLIILLLIKYL